MDTVYAASSLPGLEILSCTGDQEFAPHLHDGYVLWLNSACGEHFALKGSSAILQPGSLSIIEPGVIHTNHPCRPDSRHLRSFYFSESFLAEVSTKITGSVGQPTLPTCIISDRRLWRLFINLHDALLQAPAGLQAEAEILFCFARLSAPDHDRDAPEPGTAGHKRIATVIEYLHANIERQFTLDELAGLLHCTGYHLIRLFRAATGVAPHTYLMQLRLEHARKMLACGHAIVDAALRAGFSDQSHLTRLFKARFGVTPGTYRKQRRL